MLLPVLSLLVGPARAQDASAVQLDPAIDLVVRKGRKHRPVVVQYSDWRCPHCYTAMPIVFEAVKNTRSTLVFRSFPFGSGCNPVMTGPPTPGGTERCELAAAAVCAHETGDFFDFAARAQNEEGLLYTLRKRKRFARCMNDPHTKATVRAQAQSGVDIGLLGTPTFFVRIDGTWREAERPEDVPRWLEEATTR